MDIKVKLGKLKDRFPAKKARNSSDGLDAAFMDDSSSPDDSSQDDSSSPESPMDKPFAGGEDAGEEGAELGKVPDDVLQAELEKRGFHVMKAGKPGDDQGAQGGSSDDSSDDLFS